MLQIGNSLKLVVKQQACSSQPISLLQAMCSAFSTIQQQDVHAACVLERLPVVMPAPPEWEVEYKEWALQRKVERNFFKKYPVKDKKVQAQQEGLLKQTQHDQEEEGDDKKTFQPVPTITPSDLSGDRRCMKRKLDERVFLIVKSSTGGWEFPQAKHASGETIRQAAVRALRSVIGNEQRLYHIGNAPMGHLDVKSASAPVFFLLSQVLHDPWQVHLQPDSAADFAWVTKGELGEYFKDEEYRSLAEKML